MKSESYRRRVAGSVVSTVIFSRHSKSAVKKILKHVLKKMISHTLRNRMKIASCTLVPSVVARTPTDRVTTTILT